MCCDISTGSISALCIHRLIGSNHHDLTGVNVLDSFLHNHHTMLAHSWRIYAFIDQWKKNRCSSKWWHLFWAFLMTGSPVACPSNCFFMRIATYIINKLQPFVCTSELDGLVASSLLNLFSLWDSGFRLLQ